MTEHEAKQVLADIRSIERFRQIIKEINFDLETIETEIESVATPSCPNGGNGVKCDNHVDKSTLINSLLSDEMELDQKKKKYELRQKEAELNYQKLLNVIDESELRFVQSYIDEHMSYHKLSVTFGFENPYKHMISLIKKI